MVKNEINQIRKKYKTDEKMQLINSETAQYETRIMNATIALFKRREEQDNFEPRWIK